MNFKNLKQRLKTKDSYNEMGCLGLAGIILGIFAVLIIAIPLIQLLFCNILGLKCIDDETGEAITISWALFVPLGGALFLILIDKAYYRIKNNK